MAELVVLGLFAASLFFCVSAGAPFSPGPLRRRSLWPLSARRPYASPRPSSCTCSPSGVWSGRYEDGAERKRDDVALKRLQKVESSKKTPRRTFLRGVFSFICYLDFTYFGLCDRFFELWGEEIRAGGLPQAQYMLHTQAHCRNSKPAA